MQNNLLTQLTGDPFCDIGGHVIRCLQDEHKKDDDTEKLVEYITNIYIKHWKQKLHSFFFNSKLTHNSVSGKYEKAFKGNTEYYKFKPENAIREGYCRITGQKTLLFPATRMNSILTSAGSMVNFNHGFEEGLLLSREALIRILFTPFGAIQIGGQYAVIYSNDVEITKYFTNETCTYNLNRISINLAKGVRKSKYNNPSSALFHFADKLYYSDLKIATLNTKTGESETKGIALNIMHFTNFAQDATIQLYQLPAIVFQFYHLCISQFKDDWNAFIRANYIKYRGYKAKFDTESASYLEVTKESTLIEKKDFQYIKQHLGDISLAIVGTKKLKDKKTKKDIAYQIFNKNEFSSWKQSKQFKEWKEDKKYKELKGKTLKEEIVLQYQFEDYSAKWINVIYEKLINNKSILSNILKWNTKHSFNFEITKIYLIAIRNMNKKTLECIERIAEFAITDQDELKGLNKIRYTKNPGELRSYILKMIERNYSLIILHGKR